MTIYMKPRYAALVSCFVVAFFSLDPSLGFSQITPSVEPGVIIRDIKEEKRTPSRVEDIVSTDRDRGDTGLDQKKVFTLEKVVLEGSTIYSQQDIDALVKDYVGQKTSFADIDAIARLVTKKYRDDGYVFSRAVVAPQKIKGGTVRLRAIEGRVTDVKILGSFKDHNDIIKDMAEKIKSAGPSNEREIERYLLLIDDLPGITARSLLQPSKTPGGGELVITIEEDDFEGSVGVDNRGSRYLGPYRGTLVGAFNSIFGIHDRTTLRVVKPSDFGELTFADIVHEEQIGSEGTKAKGRFAYTETEPGDSLDVFDIKGSSRLFDVELEHPFLRSRKQNVNVFGGFNALNSESEILGLNTATDRVRSLRGGVRFDLTDSLQGINQVELQLTKGVDVFDATTDGLGRSRATGKHDFFRTNVSFTRIQDIANGFSAQLSASGQYSADPLLSSEEFSIGGSEFGRAYDSGEIAGDSGVTGLVELRYSGVTDNKYLKTYQVYSFYDIGKVWNENIVVSEKATESLSSLGAGVRFNLDQEITGSLEVSKPLTRDVSAEGNRDPRVFFSMLKRF